MPRKLKIHTDGGARGNPGPAGIGVVIYDENNQILEEKNEYLGVATNNQAEYQAVLLALEMAKKYAPDEVDFFLDSELVVKQIKREYKVKNKDLVVLFSKVCNQLQGYKKISFHHIRREYNKEADRLANLAMDRLAA